jgi:hypothetical protein
MSGATQGSRPTVAQLAPFLDAVEGRNLTVHVSRAHERRLRANHERCDEDCSGEATDADLEIALLATSDRGLYAGESDAGVWTSPDGREWLLPRRSRCGLRLRLRVAVRAAVTAWRAA